MGATPLILLTAATIICLIDDGSYCTMSYFIDIGADRLREMEEQDFVEGEEDLLDLPYENELEDD